MSPRPRAARSAHVLHPVRARVVRLAGALITASLLSGLLAGSAVAGPGSKERALLLETAQATWRSFVAMTDPETGLTADNLTAEGVRARYTSPTNIGSYLWSTIAARDLGIISAEEARARMAQTLTTVASLERAHGQFYNWYDPETGERLHTWPADGSTVHGFLSSVDNGWLAAALMMVANAEPALAPQAEAILDDMNFGFYYDPGAGLLRGGAWTEPPPGCSVPEERDGSTVYFTCHHYGALNTEPRIASYIGIAAGDIPATHYFKLWRTFPDTCDWGWQEQQPVGEVREYLGVEVFEGTYGYRDLRLVPSWGGSMFEALMVPLLVPEEEWAPRTWGRNHPVYVRAQIEHGLEEADYGYWGFSPSNNPDGGYREYGVDPIGLEPNGYASDQERTHVDYGFGECRPAQPEPTDYGRGVVTPHAVFLALEYAPREALANLANLREDFDLFHEEFGWYDAVDVVTGTRSEYFLALDQGMIMAAVANRLQKDRLQGYFADEVEAAIRPLISIERWDVGRRR